MRFTSAFLLVLLQTVLIMTLLSVESPYFFSALPHVHHLLVLLFTISISYKAILLLINKTDALETYRKKTLVPEILISVLVLASGFYMLFANELVTSEKVYHIKGALVLLMIPLGIVGFKKKKKALAAIVMLTLLSIYAYMITTQYIL